MSILTLKKATTMNNNIACKAEDIKAINQQKEYTLISTRLLQLLFSDQRLNDHAIKCWQLLFNKSRFHPNLEITISYTRDSRRVGQV